MKKLLSWVAFLSLLPVVALADTAEIVTYTFDLSGLAKWLVGPAIAGVAGLLFLGVRWVRNKFNLQTIITDSHLQAALDRLIAEASAYAVAKLEDKKVTTVTTKSQVLATGLQYVNDHAPALAAKSGLDSDKLMQKIEAKLTSDWDINKRVEG